MRSASVIMLILAVSYSQQAQGVCVFDLGSTLTNVMNRNLSKAAVKACEDREYKIAINSAELGVYCQIMRMVRHEDTSGVTYGGNVPKKMWMCRGWNLLEKSAKIANMKKAMLYYHTTKECTVLFDDNVKNVGAVISAGFKGIQVNHDGQGISAADSAAGLAQLRGCHVSCGTAQLG